MTIRPYQHMQPPTQATDFSSVNQNTRRLYDALFRARQGKLDCIAEVTLTAGAATTTLNDVRLSNQSVVLFDPKTANAAAELAAGTMYVLTSNRGNASWTITHANNAHVDRTFQVLIIG